MTDKDIIKALECCTKGEDCKHCPLKEELPYCSDDIMVDAALDLINRQQAEIERLKKHNTEVAYKHYNDGIKEFAERLKSLVNQHHYMLANVHNSKDFGMFTLGFEQAIDEVVKELVGDTE